MTDNRNAGFYETHNIDSNDRPFIFHKWNFVQQGVGFSAHWHPNIELLYITDGEARITINSETISARKDDVVVIHSNAIHSLISDSSVSYYCLIIDHNFCFANGFDYTKFSFQNKFNNPAIKEIIETIITEITPPLEPYHHKIVKSLTLTLVGLVFRHALQDERNQDVPYNSNIALVKAAIEFIEQNYQQPLSIDTLCKQVKVSKFYFCRIFKSVTGQTINKYLNNFRCERAKILLSNSNASIAECGLESGFNDPSYFAKCYKRRFGYMPSQEKRMNLE